MEEVPILQKQFIKKTYGYIGEKYGEIAEEVDLRWGVDTLNLSEEESGNMVINVCIDAIDRCVPYLIVLLGERYGWIPDSKMIQTAVEGKADKLVLDDYEKSITALEIEFGALSENYGELDKCVVCMRSPLAHLIMDKNVRMIYLEENPDINIYIENMFEQDPYVIKKIAKELSVYDNFGLCLDWGHAALSNTSPMIWADELKEYVKHIHLNDNDLRVDTHLAWGSGQINRNQFYNCYNRYLSDATILIETVDIPDQRASLRQLEEDGFIK